MIKAIVLDLGGVLVDLDMERCRRAFIEDVGYTAIDDILDAFHQKGFYSDLEEGKLSADEFRALILKGARKGTVPSDVDHAMWSLLTGVEPYKVDMLKSLSERYDLYVLSNNNSISMERCRELFREAGADMEHLFKAQFLSYQMKMQKPSRQIYEAVVAGIGLAPGEILFIDDSLSNVDAASSVGINAMLYRQGADLRAAIDGKLEELAKC